MRWYKRKAFPGGEDENNDAKAFPGGEYENDDAKAFPGGEKNESERGREDGAGHYVMESLEEPRLCESPPMWDGLYVWTRIDRMGSRIPVICYVYHVHVY